MVLKQRQSVHDPDRGFENDVKMYGTQTNTELLLQNLRLRMM